MRGAKQYSFSLDASQVTAVQMEAVIHEKYALAVGRGRGRHPGGGWTGVDSNDASWDQGWKCKRVLLAELGIEEAPFIQRKQFPSAFSDARFRDLRYRYGSGSRVLRESLGKPRNPLFVVVDRRVEENGLPPRGEQLKSRNIVQSESKNGEPVAQTIVGDLAECRQAMDIRTGSSDDKIVVKALRNVIRRRAAENLGGAL